MGLKNSLKRCLKFSNSGQKLKSSSSKSKLELNFDVSAFYVVFILAAAGLDAFGGPTNSKLELSFDVSAFCVVFILAALLEARK